jgi:hypothetical protein
MSNTADGLTHFVLGKEDNGNRELHNIADGEEYYVDYEYTNYDYSDSETDFPYTS